MKPGRALVAFLVLVGLVGGLSAAVLVFVRTDSDELRKKEDPSYLEAEKHYASIRYRAGEQRAAGRLAAALAEYGRFPVGLLGTPAGKRVEDEKRALVREINQLFQRDDPKLRELLDGASPDPVRALELIDSTMMLYCHDRLLRYILAERAKILKSFNDAIRDEYQTACQEFRKRMEARQFLEALQWMADFTEHARLPSGYSPRLLEHRGVDYAALRKEARDGRPDGVAALVEPPLSLVANVGDMQTPLEILFDLLCASYGWKALQDAKRGLAQFAEKGDPMRVDSSTVTVVFYGGKYHFRAPDGKTREVPGFSEMEVEEIEVLATRGLSPEMDRTLQKRKADAAFHLRIGVLCLFSKGKRVFHAGQYFEKAARLGSPLGVLFLDAMSHVPAGDK